MSNRKMNLSGYGKETLDLLCDHLSCDRPLGLKIALAKAIKHGDKFLENTETSTSTNKWTIPDNIIRDTDYLLFKHLIINEVGSPLNEEEVNNQMLNFIENGLKIIRNELNNLASLEDYRIAVLK